MRLSVRRDDPGHSPEALRCRVFVDGVDVTNRCFTADEEEGKAWCYAHNDRGQPYANSWGKPVEEVLKGKVEIRLRAR